ncbi:MAG: class I SAM-dependent methyltransferase [candidate division WOR-3 bacterium]|nr:class I SAM-dependent methyltransferase [candidate division WOR-3 bacterium]
MGEALFDRIARLYDHEQKEFTNDIPFYVEYAKECRGEVLELGCGTGRVLIPIAREGIKVTGLDVSQKMLSIASKKIQCDETAKIHATLTQGDMKSFNLNKKFSLIYIAFRSFQCLLTKNDQISCLKCVRDHLSDSGLFILDLFAPRHDFLAQAKRSVDLGRFYDEEKQLYVTRRAEDTYDLAKQTLHEDRYYEWTDKLGKSHRQVWTFELGYLFRYEAELLLEKCGFSVEKVLGGFDGSPYDYISGEQIFILKKTKKNSSDQDRSCIAEN